MTAREKTGAPASAPVRGKRSADLVIRAVAQYQVREACLAALDGCAELAAAGCLVIGARALPHGAVVRVAPPPAWTGLKGAMRKRTRVAEVLVSRLASGVLVEWVIPRLPKVPAGVPA